ncbi:NAD(P)H dehydrogenase (quinone) [Salvia divinorum]|uniref:NAD(P)H dehydrogenase (quinone) n=1 Tax=Salvia divinorum TaxID=28513 RepID=A0ABD1I3L0_SALDI
MYGHVEKLAEEIKKGAASVEGVEAQLWQVTAFFLHYLQVVNHIISDTEVEERISSYTLNGVSGCKFSTLEVELGKIYMVIWFGMMAAQFKAFFDATGGLWRTQQLAGKPAAIFYSTGSQGGDQETTALTAITQLVHHGMIFVSIGYTFGAGMFEMEKVKGGSPYGAGTYAGDGSRRPSELELQQAFHQGKYLATIAMKLKGGAA